MPAGTRAAAATAAAAGRAARRGTVATSTKRKPGKGRPLSSASSSRPPPQGWERTYSLIKELRSDRSAPVDLFGAEALAEKHASAEVQRFQTLIALMLSSQTTDEVVGACMARLQSHGCSLESLSATPDNELHALLRGPPSVGFHNNKTKFIAGACRLLRDEHDGRVPDTFEGLVALPGVGPKMAHIVLNVAFNKVLGIGVDTHVHRICNELAWVQSKQPEQTRKQLEGWLPRPLWGEVNLLMVGLGQEVQKHKEKLLKKALTCSDPAAAIALCGRLGLDCAKVAARAGLTLPTTPTPDTVSRPKKKRKR